MELSHLKAFVTVAEEGNLTRSAKKLFLTQPALSAQISGLEKELGIKLFYRGSKGMTLSLEGKNLVIKAKEVLAAADSFKHVAIQMKGEIKGTVYCSFNLDSSLLYLSDLVSVLSKEAPKITIGFKQVISSLVIESLKNSKMDMGFALGNYYKCPANIEFIKLFHFHVSLVAPLSWRKQLETIKEEDLSSYPFILLPSYSSFQKVIESFIKRNNIKAAFYSDHENAIAELVSKEKGISFMLYEDAIRKSKELCVLDKFMFPISLNLYYKKESKNNPACNFVIKTISSFWENQAQKVKRSL